MHSNIHIKPSEISQGKMIGSGGFGAVYKGRWSGSHVAIKMLACQHMDKETSQEFMRELELMASLRSPKLIQVYGGVFEKGSMAIVMELVSNGNLYEQLRANESMPWTTKYSIGMDIAYGLKYLHDRGIIHRDLKSLNVLLDNEMNAKICDFGLAKVKTQSQSTTTMGGGAGTILWMAPELFGMRAKNTEKTDVYALGMVLYELLTHKLPFADFLDGKKAEYVVPRWLENGERPEMPSYGDRNFKDLIQRCWHQNSGSRPTADQVASRLEEMTKAKPKSDAGKASEGGLKEADLPTSTTGLLGSIVNYLSSMSLFSQATEKTKKDGNLPLSTKDINPMPSAVLSQPSSKIPSVLPPIDQGQVNKLLDHVMRGEQDEAEQMIKANPHLLNHKGAGKEFHNGRMFKSITPFQYALWALDWYMWDMMMKYIDHSQARSQLEELESRGTEHGKQFDGFDRLINAYQVYVDKYDGWNYEQCKQHWCKVVGGAQKGLPVHALQEYWRKDRSMDPTPDFKDKRGKDHGDLAASISSERFAVSWAAKRVVAACSRESGSCTQRVGDHDRSGIVSLKDTRNSQYKELRETLSKAPGLRIR